MSKITVTPDINPELFVSELLAFHKAHFGDARMEAGGGGDGAGAAGAGGDGAAGAGADGAQGGAGAADGAGAGAGAPAGENGGQGAESGDAGQQAQRVEDLPAWAQKRFADLTKQAGDARINAKKAAADEARQELLKKLGLVEGDEKPDPDKLAADLAAKDATIRDLTIKSALTDALHTNSAKPIARAAILGDGILKDLDPSASDFPSKVDDAVKAYLEKYPELKATRAAGTSSADHAGGTGEGANRPKTLGDAVASRYGR